MSLGRIALVAAGTVAGGLVCYAAYKSETVRGVAKSAVQAGVKAKDWTVDTYNKTTGEFKEIIRDAKAEAELEA
ncbi:hypothetical protein [Desulfovibrio sp. JC010]|uniref:hypothetical protein n=1 Tax=Desulfovibrio sp. JC010 TaxID=2593641 RepID=UPI0013D30588|nr:hypothetical protein [Desulfovibrio sp. JC010]NDV26066.1 hypothetical protein [Desulfovibrio sp. JC010]